MENITINVSVNTEALAELEKRTLEAAKAAGFTEKEYRALSGQLGQAAKRVADLRQEQARLQKRLQDLKKTQDEATDPSDVEAYRKEWEKVEAELKLVRAELKKVDKASDDAEESGSKSFGKLGKILGGLGKIAGGLGLALIFADAASAAGRFFSEAAKLAPQIEALDAKAVTVLGDELERVAAAARESAASMGLTESQYISANAAIADLLVPMGFTRDVAASMSIELVNLSGALSEWTGGQKSATEVAETLQKAVLGEREGLKSLGISISENDIALKLAEKGQQNLTGAVLQQAKAQATLELVLEKSTDAQTAFAENTDSLLRKQTKIAAVYDTIQEALSRRLIPIMQVLSSVVLGVAEAFLGLIRVTESEALENSRREFNLLVQTLEKLRATSDGSAESQRRQQAIIDELNGKYSELLGTNIDLNTSSEELRKATDQVNIALQEQIDIAGKNEERERLIAQQKALTDETLELEKAIVRASTESEGFFSRLAKGILAAIPGVGALVRGIDLLTDFIKEQTGGQTRLNKANQEQIDIAERLNQLNQELADSDLAKLLKENEEGAQGAAKANRDLGTSLDALKEKLKGLQDEFSATTSETERISIGREIVAVQDQITRINAIIKPDSETRSKAKKAADDQQKEIEAALKDAEKLAAEVAQLRFDISLRIAGGKETEAGLEILRQAELEKIRQAKAFQELERQDAELAGKLLVSINQEFDTQITEVRKKELENRLSAIQEQIDKETKLVRENQASLVRDLAVSDLGILESQLPDIEKLEAQLRSGEIAVEDYQQRLAEIEEAAYEARLEKQIEFLTKAREQLAKAQAENLNRISELQQVADPNESERFELDRRLDLNRQFEQELIDIKAESAQKQLDIIRKKNEDEIKSDEKKKEDLLEITQQIAAGTNVIYGGITSFFEIQKKKELEAAGQNAAAREEIERRFARKQQEIALANAIIQGSVATIRAFADLGPIAGAIAAVGLGITIATAIAEITAQSFFEGTEYASQRPDADRLRPGQSRGRDKIRANLDEGERVVPRDINLRYFQDFSALQSGKLEPGVVAAISDFAPEAIRAFLALQRDAISPGISIAPKPAKVAQGRPQWGQVAPVADAWLSSIEPRPDVMLISRDYTEKAGESGNMQLDYKKMGEAIAKEGNDAFWDRGSGFLQLLREQQDSNMEIRQMLRKLLHGN